MPRVLGGMPTLLRCCLASLLALAAVRPLAAQGMTAELITGTVTADGKPLEGAQVEAVSGEGGITRKATTNAKGRFSLLFPDGQGTYRVTIRAIGYAPVTRQVQRTGDDDRIVVQVAMTQQAVQLQELVARARPAPQPRFERAPPGTSERVFDADRTTRLPVDAADPAALAALTPGVVTTGANDSSAAGISIGGQRPNANNTTLDGLSFGADQLPQDGLRNTRVITSTYDVSRGQFSGGQVAISTRSGSNVYQGSATTIWRDRALALGADGSNPFAQGIGLQQVSGGFGGPIVRDRLFFFASGQGRWTRTAFPTLDGADAATLARLGVSADSVDRFRSVVPATAVGGGFVLPGADRASVFASGLLRLDWTVSDAHSVTLRGDLRDNAVDPARAGPLSLPGTGGTQGGSGGGVFAQLTSRLGDAVVNEARAYWSRTSTSATPFLELPAGRVLLASDLPDGSQGFGTLGFGGNASLPQAGRSTLVEVVNETAWLVGDGSHRLKLGLLVNHQTFAQDVAFNRFGTFVYPSLDALAANQPQSFTRTLSPLVRDGAVTNAALWLGDTWRTTDRFQLTYGLRLEHTRFGEAPALNAPLADALGVRTDRFPTDTRLSPRAGFSWSIPGPQDRPFWGTLRGGVGEFRGTTAPQLLAGIIGGTGLAGGEEVLQCVGPGVPVADWSVFAANPTAIPTACVPGFASQPTTALPSVTAFDPAFASPRTWRGSLGLSRRLGRGITLTVEAAYARGTAQTGFADANLVETPFFALVGEGGRPVFSPLTAFVPPTGVVNLAASRRDPAFGRVLLVGSDLASDALSSTLGLSGLVGRGTLLSLSYTWQRARDQSSFAGFAGPGGFDAPTTGGNPNAREWFTSDLERRHQLVGTVTHPLSAGLEVSGVVRVLSGAPFTPLVQGDVNGDGSPRNDRAFIPAPASVADPVLRDGLARVLASDAGACLAAQVGAIAGRNSCRGPWQPAVDLQVNWRPGALGLDRRLVLSVLTQNLMGGLDQLLHGADNLRGWGGFVRPDPVLLNVQGFDPVAQRFAYALNERFGTSAGNRSAFRVPFQLGVQARLILGSDPNRDRLLAAFGGAGGGGGGGPITMMMGPGGVVMGGAPAGPPAGGGGPTVSFGAPGAGGPGAGLGGFRAAANPIRFILDKADSLALALSDEQRAALTPIADSIDTSTRELQEKLRRAIQGAGVNADPAQLFGQFRGEVEKRRLAARAAMERAKAILTPEQFEQLPTAVQNAGQQLQFFGPGAGGGGGRRPTP